MRRLVVALLLVAGVGLIARDAAPCRLFALQPRCYVALHPGPANDSLRSMSIDGSRTYASAGKLLFTTVSVDTRLDLGEWLAGSFDEDTTQVRREVLYPPNEDEATFTRRNLAEMDRSKLDAAAAALAHLDYDVDLAPRGAEVVEELDDVALAPGDVITAVAGQRVSDAKQALRRIESRPPGTPVTLTVRRSGQRLQRMVRVRRDEQGAFFPVVLRDHVELPVAVDIEVGDVGGPSAGLMFAVAIVDTLTPRDLTGGAVIAGTGTINAEGRVGAVGGLRQKILGALTPDDGRPATVFLAPAGEVDAVRGLSPERELTVVPVSDLSDAVDALERLRAGGRPGDAIALGVASTP